jgi:hypothetical protein
MSPGTIEFYSTRLPVDGLHSWSKRTAVWFLLQMISYRKALDSSIDLEYEGARTIGGETQRHLTYQR